MANLSCCFTGHRIIPSRIVPNLYRTLLEEIEILSAVGYTEFYAGGALGFDTLAAQAVLQKRTENPNLHLHLILPCKNQQIHWHIRQQKVYETILEQADSFEYVSEIYSPQAMRKRNCLLVENSHFCLCYLHRGKSGTASTVKYALRLNRGVKNLYEEMPADILQPHDEDYF